VSESLRENVAAYIRMQEEHHSRRSFSQELSLLLQKNGVPFDREHFLD